MESEAVLICMAFPSLRKYIWQEDVGEEGGWHSSSVAISLTVRSMKQYRRPCTVIKACFLESQARSWDVHRMVALGQCPSSIFCVCFAVLLPSYDFRVEALVYKDSLLCSQTAQCDGFHWKLCSPLIPITTPIAITLKNWQKIANVPRQPNRTSRSWYTLMCSSPCFCFLFLKMT